MTYQSDKRRLVAVISLLLIAGFLITSLASFFTSRASLRSEISHTALPLTSDNIYSEIQRDLLRPVFISSLMAHDTFLRDWVLNGEVEPQRLSKYLKTIHEKYDTVTSFFVSEKSGIYYYVDGILKQVSPTEERDEWYFRVREMQQDYEINIDPDLANRDEMTIFINHRVYDYDRNYIGATGVGLTVSTVRGLIETYQEKYNRTIYFVDTNGQITLAGGDPAPPASHVSELESTSLFEQALEHRSERSFTHRRAGKVVHTNVRYLEEFDWHLVVEQPEEPTVQPILTTLLINLVVCAATTAVVLILLNLSITAYQRKIDTLRGIVPICSYCKQIRDDKGYWNQVEAYVEEHTEAQFSHSVCPTCMKAHYPDVYQGADEIDGS